MLTHRQPHAGATPDCATDNADALDLSCLLDGELDGAERDRVLSFLLRDEQAQQLWSTLHVVGDAIRSSDVACAHRAQFQARIAAWIADEPPIVARHAHRIWRVVLPGAAVAAAAAMLLVVAVPQLRGKATDGPVLAARPQPAERERSATPLSVTRPMNPYLHAHREFAAGGVFPPSAPYLRTSATLPAEARR